MRLLTLTVSLFMLANSSPPSYQNPFTTNPYLECDETASNAQFCEDLYRNGACRPGQCGDCVALWSTYLSCMMQKISEIRLGKIILDNDPTDTDHPDRPPSNE